MNAEPTIGQHYRHPDRKHFPDRVIRVLSEPMERRFQNRLSRQVQVGAVGTAGTIYCKTWVSVDRLTPDLLVQG